MEFGIPENAVIASNTIVKWGSSRVEDGTVSIGSEEAKV